VVQQQEIQDQTETDLVNLRRTIYLTIQSSMQADEAAHKLLSLQVKDGQVNPSLSLSLARFPSHTHNPQSQP